MSIDPSDDDGRWHRRIGKAGAHGSCPRRSGSRSGSCHRVGVVKIGGDGTRGEAQTVHPSADRALEDRFRTGLTRHRTAVAESIGRYVRRVRTPTRSTEATARSCRRGRRRTSSADCTRRRSSAPSGNKVREHHKYGVTVSFDTGNRTGCVRGGETVGTARATGRIHALGSQFRQQLEMTRKRGRRTAVVHRSRLAGLGTASCGHSTPTSGGFRNDGGEPCGPVARSNRRPSA